MDVSCPSCSARYVTNDEKLRGKTARMRCKACNTAWMVTGPAAIDADSGPASKKTAAVVKTGSDREQRDLFAARDLDHGSVKDRSAPPPKYGFTGIGARDENSLLFRVDQLSSSARIKTPTPEKVADVRVSSSDDGVIDLKALSSAPQQARQVAPLFSEAPPAMAVDVDGPVAAPFLAAKAPWMVRTLQAAGAAAILLVTGIGLSVMFKTEEPTRAAATVQAPVETVAPAAVIPPPAPVAVAPVEETPTETKAEPKGKRGKGKGGKGRGAKSVATASKPAPGPKALPKPADPCGCKGNFNCILACTAKGRS